MVARAREVVHRVGPVPNRVAGRIEAIVRRATAIAALGWLGYVGYLLRDCPRSGAICQTSGFAISAAVVALGLVLLGHVAGRAASGLERRLHAHHAAH